MSNTSMDVVHKVLWREIVRDWAHDRLPPDQTAAIERWITTGLLPSGEAGDVKALRQHFLGA